MEYLSKKTDTGAEVLLYSRGSGAEVSFLSHMPFPLTKEIKKENQAGLSKEIEDARARLNTACVVKDELVITEEVMRLSHYTDELVNQYLKKQSAQMTKLSSFRDISLISK